MNFCFFTIKGIPGLRMVVFSSLLMIVILFFRKGHMGTNEFSWDKIINIFKRKPLVKEGTE